MKYSKWITLSLTHAVVTAGLLAWSAVAFAFNTIGSDPGSKWDDPAWGSGAIVTWSFMTPGAGLGEAAPDAWSGTNTLGTNNEFDIRKKIDDVYGAGAFDAAVRRAFATWSAAANIRFVEVADTGGDFATVTSPDIRIGAFHFGLGDFAGAAGFGPPGNDLLFPDALAGDIALNDLNNFAIDPGSEDDALQTGPGGLYLNDIEGLMLHEIGHTLGLGHSDMITGVMCGFIFPGDVFDGSDCNFTHVNRDLEPDDLNGIRTIYGLAPDTDADGVVDSLDNCTNHINTDQRNTDGDAFGNRCDADFDGNQFVNFADQNTFKSRFGTNDAHADFDGNGFVNFADQNIFKSLFGKAPGPSGFFP